MSETRSLVEVIPAAAAEWWRTAVVYQVYPRSFADSDGDGIGDLRGLIDRIDYLEYLGVDVVWLSPIYASPQDDNGYDISDYRAIDPVFGTLADFDELVARLHERGIRLILDLVVNHTSDEHPWFRESASSLDNPKRDWYWWRPPRPGRSAGEPGAEPNNWESFFSGSVWELDDASGQYYLHLFSRKQPDLNWENPEVRAAVHDMMGWWLDRGVDGFRMDVINLISKEPALPDGPVMAGKTWGDGFDHYSYGPRIHEFLREMHDVVFAPRAGTYLTVGEMPGVTVEQARRFTNAERRELSMVFQFEHVGLDHGELGKWHGRPLNVGELKLSMRRWQDGMSTVGWNSLYWNNHDQPRAVSRFGDDGRYWAESAKLLAAVLHLQRGTPFIYQGEELGMTNAPFGALEEVRDIESLNYVADAVPSGHVTIREALAAIRERGRDNARTPMQWTEDRHAGFTTGEPWIMVNPNHTAINAAQQRGRDGSVLEFYRTLIRLRHSDPVISWGTFRMLGAEHPSLFCFVRELDEVQLLVVGNFGEVELGLLGIEELDIGSWAPEHWMLGNYARTMPDQPLRPWEVRVLRRRG